MAVKPNDDYAKDDDFGSQRERYADHAGALQKPRGRSNTRSGTDSIDSKPGGRKIMHRMDSRRDLGKKLG